MNKMNPYVILLGLAMLLVTALGCDIIAGYDPVSAGPTVLGYSCKAEIYRVVDGPHEFVERWQATV